MVLTLYSQLIFQSEKRNKRKNSPQAIKAYASPDLFQLSDVPDIFLFVKQFIIFVFKFVEF